MFYVVETNGVCASTGNPSVFRTLSRHRKIAKAVAAWRECPFQSHKIVDDDGRPVEWNTDGFGHYWIETRPQD